MCVVWVSVCGVCGGGVGLRCWWWGCRFARGVGGGGVGLREGVEAGVSFCVGIGGVGLRGV